MSDQNSHDEKNIQSPIENQSSTESEIKVLRSQIDILQRELDTCRSAHQEWKERFLRVSADFENFKKRVAKDQAHWTELAQVEVLTDLIPIIDDFDRAFNELEKQPEAITPAFKTWVSGIVLVRTACMKLLHDYGIEEMKEYVTFDPQLHEALLHVDSPGHKTGDIVSVLQKGYVLKDRVVRPAKVSVAK